MPRKEGSYCDRMTSSMCGYVEEEGRAALIRTLLLLSQGPALWPLVAVVTPIEDLFLNTAALGIRTLI